MLQRIVYEAKTGTLISQGYLCPITTKAAVAEVETGNVPIRGDDFSEDESQKAFMAGDNVSAACMEILDKCHDRHSILIFASGVFHAESIARTIETMTSERVGVVTGETLAIERSSIMSDFRNMKLRFVVNVGVMTKGTNIKCIDAVAILRMSMSPGLIAQMAGRGLRLHESKRDCLILDFGQNFKRFGPIDDENFGRSEGKGRAGVAAENGRGKRCPSCELDVSPSTVVCPECNFIFPRERELKHDITADETSQLTGATPPEEWEVKDVVVRVHTKKDDSEAPQTVRVDYICTKNGIEGNLATITIPEWTCPGHQGFARSKFLAWWDARSLCDPPDNATDAVALINMGVCRRPVRITTKKDGRWHRITECFFESEKPTELAQQEETKVYSGIEGDCPF
jgi:DNA repair protein RadD